MSSERLEPMRENETVDKEKVFACQYEEHKKMRSGVSICTNRKMLTIKKTAGLQERQMSGGLRYEL